MRLDIRLPIGLMFSLLGALLMIYGVISDDALYERSLGYNLNLLWGAVLLVFGLFMLVLSRRGTAAARLAEEDPEGREMMNLPNR
ncbi:MAG TPA: hypothetical protein VFO52_07425 [Longimicrobiales bacterium]|nr:hypothetical protein [Longimicrobiales bacterium]